MKIITSSTVFLKSLLFIAVLTLGQAQAAMVQFTVNGEITNASTGNIFNASVSDIITATGHFDDSLISSGESIISFSSFSNNMEIYVGDLIYTDAMDVLGGADMYFINGVFDGIDYKAIDGSFDSWGYVGLYNVDFTGYGIEGKWDAGSYSVTPVPLPGAFWLFGFGIFLISSIFKRNRLTKF